MYDLPTKIHHNVQYASAYVKVLDLFQPFQPSSPNIQTTVSMYKKSKLLMSEKCLGFFFGYCVFGIVRRREMQWYYCVLEVFRIKEETSDYGLFVIRNTAYVRRLRRQGLEFFKIQIHR